MTPDDSTLAALTAVCFVTILGLLVAFMKGRQERKEEQREEDTGHKSEFRNEEALIGKYAFQIVNKMKKNSHKSHWSIHALAYLLKRLKQEVTELEKAIDDLYNGDGDIEERIRAVQEECADVGAIGAMISDNAEQVG